MDRKDQNSEDSLRLIDRTREILIERIDQRSSVYIQFYTKVLVYCKVQIWPQYLGDNPSAEKTQLFKCGGKGRSDQHLVRIENLRFTEPYYFRILVHKTNSDFDFPTDSLVVKESGRNFTFLPPPGYNKLNNLPHTGTLIRASLPLGQAKVHSRKTTSSEIHKISKRFLQVQKNNCENGILRSYTPLLPPTKSQLQNIKTSGHIESTSRLIETQFDTLAIDFSRQKKSESNWNFKFTFDGQTTSHDIPAPSTFDSLKIKSFNNEISMAKASLSTDSGAFTTSTNEDLIIIWTENNQKFNNYITLLLGKNSLDSAIKCQFHKSPAVITSNLLQSFNGKKLDLLVTLNSKSVIENNPNHTVLIHSQDWRHKMIYFEKGN